MTTFIVPNLLEGYSITPSRPRQLNDDQPLTLAPARTGTEPDPHPKPANLQSLAESWRPYRAVAARLLWHFYLREKATKQKGQV